MMTGYFLYAIFVVVWIIAIYFLFNRKKSVLKNEVLSASDIIASPGKASKIRIVFDQGENNNLDIKSLSDFTVKYSDLLSENYTLPKTVTHPTDLLTEKIDATAEQKPEKVEDLNLSDYINIFTLQK